MNRVERTRNLAASPAAVWAVLADFDAISGWAPNVDHSTMLTDGPIDVGSVRRIQAGRLTVRETVVDWEPNVTLAYEISGLPSIVTSVTNRWQLAPIDGGGSAQVTLTTDVIVGPRPPQRAIERAVGRRLGATSDQMLDGLVAHLDTRSAA